ncbi:MAG TPA: peptidoglycan DD-metalloendopeptidase family protein [Acidimicrobiales bacterium]|nr:peptidoglycan DD-metalloendopeptidase family protein [Acidimicrobiales bacterium]
MTPRGRRAAKGVGLTTLLVVASLSVHPMPVNGTESSSDASRRKQDIDARVRSLSEQVEEASEEEAEVLRRLDATISKRRSIEARLAELEAEIAGVELELAAATAALDGVEADLRRASAKLADTEEGLARAREALVDRTVAAYVRSPRLEAAAALLRSGSYRDVAEADAFLDANVRMQRDIVDRYRRLRARLESERTDLTATREEVSAGRLAVASHQEELLRARAEQDELRRQAAAEESEERALLAELRSKVASFEAQIAALKRESDSIAAFLRARQAGRPATPGSGVLAFPVEGRITSGFGPRRHPILGTTRTHAGIDFAVPHGRPIRASAAGEVVVASTRGGYGLTVVVDHGGTLATLYAHQSRLAVREGQTVTRGQTIGYVGSTGLSTGPHLHFEVRVSGNPVDPRRYL